MILAWQNLLCLEKAQEFFEYLEMSPTIKNSKKILEIMGVWSSHENIEKYVKKSFNNLENNLILKNKELLIINKFSC